MGLWPGVIRTEKRDEPEKPTFLPISANLINLIRKIASFQSLTSHQSKLWNNGPLHSTPGLSTQHNSLDLVCVVKPSIFFE